MLSKTCSRILYFWPVPIPPLPYSNAPRNISCRSCCIFAYLCPVIPERSTERYKNWVRNFVLQLSNATPGACLRCTYQTCPSHFRRVVHRAQPQNRYRRASDNSESLARAVQPRWMMLDTRKRLGMDVQSHNLSRCRKHQGAKSNT